MLKAGRCRYCGARFERTERGNRQKKIFCKPACRFAYHRKDGVRLVEIARILKKILPALIDQRIERAAEKFLKENPAIRDGLNRQILRELSNRPLP